MMKNFILSMLFFAIYIPKQGSIYAPHHTPDTKNLLQSSHYLATMAGQFILGSQLKAGFSNKAFKVRLVRCYNVPENHKSKSIKTIECLFHDYEVSDFLK